MRAYNKKRKPKHWVVCHWFYMFENKKLGRYACCLAGKYKPKKPYSKRRLNSKDFFFREQRILSWGVKRDERS